MRATPDVILADRPGLHFPSQCRGCLLSVWGVCRPPLHVRGHALSRDGTRYISAQANITTTLICCDTLSLHSPLFMVFFVMFSRTIVSTHGQTDLFLGKTTSTRTGA